MHPIENETRQEKPAEPSALLLAYLDSGRKEAAFVALVERLGSLVLASALRRVGNRTLAEEVSQNVFAILARKAGSLRSHPNLSAWIFRTTQLESAKAMRSEQRHNRKITAFATESAHDQNSAEDPAEAAWQNALPKLDSALDELPAKDRALLIERFFEKKRFAEIAQNTGKTEAACKMQLKRTLDKLATLLRSRGIALSVPVVAAGLSAEFAKAAPIAAPSLASNALAAAESISSFTILTNTLLTMSTAKSSTIAAAAVLTLSLIPIVQQESHAARIRAEISRLETQSRPLIASSIPNRRPASRPSGQTIRELHISTGKTIELPTLLDDLQRVLMQQDLAGLIRVLTPVANMEPEQFARLMSDLDAYQGNPELKAQASQLLAAFAPEANFQDSLENMIRQGSNPSGWLDSLRRWAETDPEAALAWFEQARQSGDLLGKGVHSDPTPALFAELLVGIAADQPDRALDLADAMAEDERARSGIDARLLATFAIASIETGDTARLDRILNRAADSEAKWQMIEKAGRAIAETSDLESVRSLISRSLPQESNEAITGRMVKILSEAKRVDFEKRANWIVGQLDPQQAAERIAFIITDDLGAGGDTATWIRKQPAGVVRDEAQAAYASALTMQKGHKAGLQAAEGIADPTLQQETRSRIAADWLKMSPDAARRELPSDLQPRDER